MHAIKKNRKFGYVVIFPNFQLNVGSLSFKSLILVKTEEPKRASKCPGAGNALKIAATFT